MLREVSGNVLLFEFISPFFLKTPLQAAINTIIHSYTASKKYSYSYAYSQDQIIPDQGYL
jgi:hypothetical protein